MTKPKTGREIIDSFYGSDGFKLDEKVIQKAIQSLVELVESLDEKIMYQDIWLKKSDVVKLIRGEE